VTICRHAAAGDEAVHVRVIDKFAGPREGGWEVVGATPHEELPDSRPGPCPARSPLSPRVRGRALSGRSSFSTQYARARLDPPVEVSQLAGNRHSGLNFGLNKERDVCARGTLRL
jgi:hypothetical protein